MEQERIQRYFELIRSENIEGYLIPSLSHLKYRRKGLLFDGNRYLHFYEMGDGSWSVGCPEEPFQGTLLSGATLGDAIDTWHKAYKQKPEGL